MTDRPRRLVKKGKKQPPVSLDDQLVFHCRYRGNQFKVRAVGDVQFRKEYLWPELIEKDPLAKQRLRQLKKETGNRKMARKTFLNEMKKQGLVTWNGEGLAQWLGREVPYVRDIGNEDLVEANRKCYKGMDDGGRLLNSDSEAEKDEDGDWSPRQEERERAEERKKIKYDSDVEEGGRLPSSDEESEGDETEPKKGKKIGTAVSELKRIEERAKRKIEEMDDPFAAEEDRPMSTGQVVLIDD